MSAVALERALDAELYGAKAASLGRSIRAGLPVPDGVAMDFELVAGVVRGDEAARRVAAAEFARVGAPRVAVRSSAIGEDGADASFAGQHATCLGVASSEAVLGAIVLVGSSAHGDGAMAYRSRLNISGAPRIGVVIQRMVEPVCAGVMFTRNPLDGSDERVIEASWGLGEAVVSGLVVPDRYRVRRGGAVVERVAGDKDVAVCSGAAGGTEHVRVADTLRATHCLDDSHLAALDGLARACEAVFDGPSDIEWAFADERLYLLQRRPVTR